MTSKRPQIYDGSPAQEFYDLAKLYVKTFGTMTSTVDTWQANLGRLMIHRRRNWVRVEYLQPCAAAYEIVWENAQGFCVDDWHQHLEALRRALILERLGDA